MTFRARGLIAARVINRPVYAAAMIGLFFYVAPMSVDALLFTWTLPLSGRLHVPIVGPTGRSDDRTVKTPS